MSSHKSVLTKYQESSAKLKAKRLLRSFYSSEIAIFIAMTSEYSFGHTLNAVLLSITALAILPVKHFVDKGKLVGSATYFLVILTISISVLMLHAEGVKDVAILGYPVILIFSAIVANRMLFITLLTIMVCNILLITYGNVTGIFVNNVLPINYSDGVIALCVIIVSAYTTWIWSNDHRKLSDQLQQEYANAVASQKLVRYAAQHDGLTGLPNRVLAADRFHQAIAMASRSKTNIALLYIDLDNFKIVNDSLGHEAGDRYLKLLATRLTNVVRDVDTVCRQGGDEFLIILNEIKDYEHVIAVAEKLITELSRKISVSSTDFDGSGSIGIAMWPDDGKDYETLLKKADMAMYHAKDSGKNNFQFYDEKLNENLLDYLKLVTELKVALKENQFELFYQPKLSISDENIIGAEALIRWRHPERGLIFPDNFIPAAEKSGLIVDIGTWVLNKACEQSKGWQQLGYENVSVAINVSPIQFMYGDVYKDVKDAINKYDITPEKLELEITESLLLDESDSLKNTVKNLNDLSVRLSIDDFGTGYSNLKYLKLFHISSIKIDQSFIRTLDHDTQDRSIVRAIIQMAQSLNMDVIAEGVENEEIRDILRQNECNFAQGYLWSKPLPINELEGFLQESSSSI